MSLADDRFYRWVQGAVSAGEARVQDAEQECARLSRVHQEEVGKLRATLQAQVCLRTSADAVGHIHMPLQARNNESLRKEYKS